MEVKRGRLLLMRQPRIKKDSESGHRSPESEPGSPRIISTSTALASAASSSSSSGSHPTTPTLYLPSSIDWQNNEPSTTITLSTSTAAATTTTIQTTTAATTTTTSSKQNLLAVTTCSNLLAVPQASYLVKQHSHPLLPSQQSQSTSGNYWVQRQHSNPEYPGRTSSPSSSAPIIGTSDPIPLIKIDERLIETKLIKDTPSFITSANSSIRIVSAESLRSSSASQQSTETRSSRESTSGHCPVQRPGPALGCNHCWNTVDTHGRTLRRKTKYHCPECQINLCIVPCFQEFHERHRENSSMKSSSSTSSSSLSSSSSSSSSLTKTSSI